MTNFNARLNICDYCGKTEAFLLRSDGESPAQYSLRSKPTEVTEEISQEELMSYELDDNEMVEIVAPNISRSYDENLQILFDWVTIENITLCQECYQKIQDKYENLILQLGQLITNFFSNRGNPIELPTIFEGVDIKT